MNRRNFIKQGSAATAVLASLSILPEQLNAAQAETPFSLDPAFPDDFILSEVTIDQLQQMMISGDLTSRSICEMYLKRIGEVDREGPSLRSVIELNPDALLIAAQMDAERKTGNVRGPLHGIPVLVKDNIDTGDKMHTTAGSLALEDYRAAKDAFIVRQLKKAGAVVLGKTNLSEWANFRSTRASSGWSSRGGQTKNPYVLDRSPCGSSSGSGAAVAANLCTVAVGTETDGSVICPASFCNIVAIKPTVGLVSRNGIIPISKTQDTAGPMARTVKDAAILLGILAGPDPDDEITAQNKGKLQSDYTRFLNLKGLNGKKIGIEKKCLEGHERVVGLFRDAIELMKINGAVVIEIELLEESKKLENAEFIVLKYEFKEGINNYLKNSGGKVKSLNDLIAFNKQNEKKILPYFRQEILEDCAGMGNLESKEYLDAVAGTTGLRKFIDELMKKNKLDAIAGIGIGLPHCIDLILGDYNTGYYFCSPAAMTGYPHINVPMGQVSALPVGLSFMAGAYEEPKLLSIAYAYEQASKKRVTPSFFPTLPA